MNNECFVRIRYVRQSYALKSTVEPMMPCSDYQIDNLKQCNEAEQ